MDAKYPTLRRPKRKLCYFANKEIPSKQWAGTLEDIDKMFDGLDPSSHDDDLLPSSPLLQTFDSETNQREAPTVPQGGHLMEKARSPSPKLDIDLEVPFKAHGPVKTSSPIEENKVVEGVEELENEKDRALSPILFACEDEEKEEAKTDPLPAQKPQCNGHITEESDDSEFESLPSKISLSKPKMSIHKNKVEGSCKESDPVKEKAPMKTQTADLEVKRKAPRHENTDPPVSAVRQEREVTASQKKSESVHRQVFKDMTTFLQKLKDAGQPKPACSRTFLSPVKVSPPPEPEDDFLILEDDSPPWFSIPSKTAISKRHKDSRTSSTDKDSSTDKGAKDRLQETAQKQQESENTTNKLGSQTINQKMKKMKGKEKKNEVTEPGNCMDELCSPEDLPAGDLMEQEKLNKNKRVKKVSSKESGTAKEQPKDTASRETDKEKNTLKMEKKAQKSSDMKRSKSLKDGKENAKTSRAKSLKGGRKVTQGSGATKEMVYDEAVKGQSEEQADGGDLGSLSDKEIMHSEAQNNGKDKHNKLPVVSEESSSEDAEIHGKRRRRQTGQWWLSCPQSTEETKVTDSQPTMKKSKQNNKEPSTAGLSPLKTKKDGALKRRNQTQPAKSSSQNTNKAKERKTKRSKIRHTRGDTPDRMKASEEVFSTIETGQTEAEHDVLDQDQDPVQSSPLVLAHRDLSLNSGHQVFQRVYHNPCNEKMSITAAPVSPRGSREQLRAAGSEKRRRKPPSNWWLVDGLSEDVESISSQPQQQEPKPRKERKKQPKQSRSPGLGTPKNGNMAALSKPLGGSPVPLLKGKPLSTPKSVKRSLATFKDIFTSAAETPAVISSREAGQNNRRKVTAHPAVEVTVTDCTRLSKTGDVFSVDAGESNSPPNHEAPPDSKCQSENMLKTLMSGPSSMIDLQQYEENDNLILPSSTVRAALSALDLCAPPLKPLILQPKDKANLTEWFKSLWSSTVDNGPEITPDQFDWYFYQGRAMGFLEDLNCGFICNGKILLGSYMKKPLWVDHSATTVFNLLTSSVSVTINGHESRFHPGQSFMVPSGHAYSIQNVTAQPAVLYFTRISAESSD